MTPYKIIFDMDDVMWNLNERAAKIAGIDYGKLTCFSPYENPNLTDTERDRLLKVYTDADTFRDIEFLEPVVDLINRIHRDYPEYPVHIVSNSATKAIRDVKHPQLTRVLNIPDNRIHLDVINIHTESTTKRLPDDIFILVDDSPHNIASANARHKIMPAKPYNDVLIDGCLNGEPVHRPESPNELRRIILDCINAKHRKKET